MNESLTTLARTSEEWWQQTIADEEATIHWLQNQYHGEATAVERIREFSNDFVERDSKNARILDIIANQETNHAAWMGELLVARGVEPVLLNKVDRYWSVNAPRIDSFENGAAVAAHTERMRLERLCVIAADVTAPADIRTTFERIVPQERFHERAFRKMAGEDAMLHTLDDHQRGRALLLLFPEDEN